MISGILRRNGYTPLEAEPARACALLADPNCGISLVVTNTPEVFSEVFGRIPLLYVASCPDPEIVARIPHCGVLAKPFHPRDLVAIAGELTV
jgi:hypothetical protein